MGRGAADLGRFAAAEVYPYKRRATVIGLVVFGGTIGAIGGPLLVSPSKAFAAQLDLPADVGPYFLGALFLIITGWIAFTFLRPDPMEIGRLLDEEEAEKKGETQKPIQRTVREVLSNGHVQLAIVAMAVGQLVMVMLMTITPLHMNHHAHSDQSISYVIMAHTIGMFGLSSVTGALVDKLGRIPMIVVGCVILLVAAFLAPASTAVLSLAVALFLLGLGWNFCFVAGSSLLADSLQANERGQIQGASDTIVSLASGLGSFSTGFLFNQWGIIAISVVGVVCTLVLLATTSWKGRQPKLVA